MSGNVPAVEILYFSNAVYCCGDQRERDYFDRAINHPADVPWAHTDSIPQF